MPPCAAAAASPAPAVCYSTDRVRHPIRADRVDGDAGPPRAHLLGEGWIGREPAESTRVVFGCAR
eukprot:5669236-Lingulodinium_polyedra.AAC.1